jgi:riboflavin kinase/FMN adenylyltransferase
MKLIEVTSITELTNYNINNVVVAIGIFDGVHLGHQLLIKKLLDSAKKYNATPIVLTFYPHPKEVLSLQHNSYQLMPQNKKVEMLGKFGVEAVVTIPFTIEFSRLSPEEFINKVLYAPNIKLSAICVGKKWRFGHKGAGNNDFLEKYSKEFNFQFEAVDEFSLTAGEKVSSSEIRRAVANGE